MSRHEIDKAKEEIVYDEHLNPKSNHVHPQLSQADVNDGYADKDGGPLAESMTQYPTI